MKHLSYLLILQCITHTILQSAGFVGSTLILTDQDTIAIAAVQPSTKITAQNGDHQTVTALSTHTVDNAIAIHTANETFVCDQNQLFWCVNTNSWTKAALLEVNDTLLTYNNEIVPIDAINNLDQETTMYSLSVTQPHHLFVGRQAILAHNVIPAIVGGISICWGAGIEITATLSAGLVFCGALIGLNWEKKDNQSLTCTPTFGHGNDHAPLFSYYTPTYRHGIYEDAEYHKDYQSGRKSPRPTNGQKALDNSISIKPTSNRRVAISDGEIVVLAPTTPGVYHGHVESWKETDDDIKAALQREKLANKRGKLLCKK